LENPSIYFWPHAALVSSLDFIANSNGVRLPRDESGLLRLAIGAQLSVQHRRDPPVAIGRVLRDQPINQRQKRRVLRFMIAPTWSCCVGACRLERETPSVGRADHHCLFLAVFRCQTNHHTSKDAFIAPTSQPAKSVLFDP